MTNTFSLPQVIGIAGRKGAGKDTSAQTFVEHDDYTVVKFAGPIKAMLRELLHYRGADSDLVERMIEGDLKEVPTSFLEGQTPRHAMQTLGTEWGRDLIGADLWVNSLKDRVHVVGHAVVTDMRFPNEVEAIKDMGGVTVRIERPGLDTSDAHPSEAMIDTLDVDAVVCNAGDIASLHADIVGGVQEFMDAYQSLHREIPL